MESTFPINYRAGWMKPINEYIPEVIPPKPQWQTRNRLPDYGPVVEDDYQPRNRIKEPTHAYQKMQYTKPFPTENPITEFENETTPLDLPNNETHQLKPPALSSEREPLHFMNTYDDQNISKREWHQKKLQGITNTSNLDQFINKLWQEVHVATSHLTAEDKKDTITTLQSKIESLPNDFTRIDAEELEELRGLGVGIPQRVNRAETVRKAIQRHIDKLESS
jgi:hypothetical protein